MDNRGSDDDDARKGGRGGAYLRAVPRKPPDYYGVLFGDVGAVRLLHRADHEPHVAGRSGRASAGGYGRRAYLR